MSVGEALFKAQTGLMNQYTPYLLAGVPWLSMPKYQSSAAAIMSANTLLKNLVNRDSHETRAVHVRLVFQEEQRKILLKQLFEKKADA